MLAVNYSTIRSKLKDYCDKATDENETIIVTRKDEKNVVLISLEKYNEFIRSGKNDAEARRCVSELLGHHRDDVTRIYLSGGDKDV